MARKIEQEYLVKDKGSKVVRTATGKINKSLSNVEAQSKKVTTAMATNWKRVITVIGAAGIGMAIVKLGRDTIAYADQLGKLSTRLGISTTQLDKLRQVADKSGIEFRTLAMAIQRMVRRISEVASGTGVAKEAIKALGLSIDSLVSKTPDEQFLDIAKSLAAVEDSGKRVELAFKLFDSEGVRVLQMVNELKDGIHGLNSEFTIERVKQIEAFNDRLADMRNTFQQLAIKVLPKLNTALQYVSDNMGKIAIGIGVIMAFKLVAWLKTIKGLLWGIAGAFASNATLGYLFGGVIPGGGKSTLGFFGKLKIVLIAVSRFFGQYLTFLSNPYFLGAALIVAGLTAAYISLKGSIENTTEAYKKLNEQQILSEEVELKKKLLDAQERLNKAQEMYNRLREGGALPIILTMEQKNIDRIIREIKRYEELLGGLELEFKLRFKLEEDAAKIVNYIRDIHDEVEKEWDDLWHRQPLEIPAPRMRPQVSEGAPLGGFDREYPGTRIAEANNLWKDFNQTTDNVAISVNSVNTGFDGVIQNLIYTKEQMKLLDPEFQKMVETAKEIGDSLQSSIVDNFSDAIMASQTFGEAFINVLKDIGKMLAKIAIQEAIIAAIKGATGGKYGSIGGLFASWFDAKGSVYDKGVRQFASGGVVDKPTLFPMADGMGMMGEAGPEAIMPLKRGPGGKLGVQASGGGNTFVSNITIKTTGQSDDKQNKKLANELIRAQEASFKRMYANELRPGGLGNRQYA